MSPFFSIVTATYNAAATLPRLLESLAHQICQDFEIIIQDGASSDETCPIAEAGRQFLPALSLVSEKDSGIYDAWNKALRRVSGKWVLFIGADDTLADERVLAAVREVLKDISRDVFFAAGSARILRPDGALFECIRPRSANAPAILRSEMPACHTAIFHRASLFSQQSFNTEYMILGDYDLLCRTWIHASQGIDVPVLVTDMAMGGLSFSLEKQPAAFMESVKIQWSTFSWIPLERSKILFTSLVIMGLSSVSGKEVAARFIDGLRRMRGKSAKWTLLLPDRGVPREPVHPANITVVILNHNGQEDTVACLRALYAMQSRPQRVIVVDNSSRDTSVDSIVQAWKAFAEPVVDEPSVFHGALPAAALILLPENGGYAAGNNRGIELAMRDPSCRAVWILNNDTEPDANSLQELCDRLNDRPEAGMAGSTLVYAHERETVQCAAGFSFSKYTGATPALHGNERLSAVLGLDPASVESSLGYLCGASMLVRREVFERISFLAEEYFLYYEDAEFGLRAQRAGYALAWAPGSIVCHKEGGSTGAKSSGAGRVVERPKCMDYLALRNRIYLVRTYFPAFVLITALSYVGVALNRIRRGFGRRVPLVLRALRDGLLGKMGKPAFLLPERTQVSKILFLTLRADFGGGPEHLWRLLQNMPHGMTAYVACPKEYPYHERFRHTVGDSHIIELPHRAFNMIKLWQLRRFCRERRISVLHSHGKGAGLYSRILAVLTGLPCIHTFHGVHMNEYTPGKRYLYRICERIMSLFTDVGIAVSEGEREQIIVGKLMSAPKLRLIRNGVGIPSNVTASGAFPSPYYTVVSLSRFDYQKNSLFLLDIARVLDTKGRLGEFRIVVVGDGADRQAVTGSAWINGWGSAVSCPGASTHPHSFFAGALCYISTSRWEGMPLAALEAMAHGLPIVASDVVGNRDAVRHGDTGFLYPEGDAAAAATALCRLADDPDLRRAMGDRAREYVLRYHSVEEMAAKTFDLLQESVRRT